MLLAVAIALVLSLLCGVWNGFLVTVLGIQPIVATLVLMTAGRGIAQLITDEQIITVDSQPYKMIGGGYWLSLPFSILLATAIFLLTALLVRRSALGVLLESVGVNPEASRLAVVADVNAVPPSGIEGVELFDRGRPLDSSEIASVGPLAIGDIKYKTQAALFRSMLASRETVMLDFTHAFAKARTLVRAKAATS